MFIDNQRQNLIRILPGDNNLSQISEFGRNLSLGKILHGKVLDIFSDGKVLTDIQGEKITLQTSGGLVKGQNISVKVEQLIPSINVKIVDPQAERQTLSQQRTVDTKVQLSQIKGQTLQKLTLNLSQSNFKPDQVIEGKVIQILDPEILQVEIQGKQLPVKITSDTVSFRPGQPVTVSVQKDSGGLILNVKNPNTTPLRVDAATIKPYLVAKQDLGSMAANLEKTVLNNPLLKELKIDPELIERLRDTIRIISPKDGKTPDDTGLKEQINRSGINYEAKVQKILSEKPTTDGRIALARDLKGQLLELQGKLEQQAAQESRQLPSTTAQGKSFLELVHQVRLASDSIEFQQLSNQFSKQDNNPILIQIADPFSPETKTAKLYVRNEGEGEGKKKDGKTDYNLVFLLNMTALGNLRVDAKTNREDVVVDIKVGKKPIVDFIASQTPQLESRLKEMGFNAVITASTQKNVEMEIDEPLNSILVDEPSRLVDIKT